VTYIHGRVLPVRGDDIDTDRIIPARFLRTVTFEGLDEHLFEDDRRAGRHPVDDERYRGASVLLVNANFGCGSSREHAPQAIQKRGIRAVIGESFAGIFFGNAAMMGMPCLTASPEDVRALMTRVEQDPTLEIRIDLAAGTCDTEGFQCAVSLPPKARAAFLSGGWDTTGQLLERYEEVDATASRLPYVVGF
jgi:3-isopropylmalate/(R)-2-methylmalate dehydratase small subunit